MSEEKFTKGEWVVDCEISMHVEVWSGEERICEVGTRYSEDVAPNAHLIAAAPEMYEMLNTIAENMHKSSNGTIGDILVIESLLAKARGERNGN